ncbi:enoyl-CoA hydratase [Virgibacillus xinjiangensis]|uniref:Enoyl-CoA hydratase n=1 Tax=Virgibacillus xinjiangensis TaxID=393090 RepID=A0ABV7CRJ2_9BACI
MALVEWKVTEAHIARITLNRPKAANSLSTELLDEMNEVICQINRDSRVYCTIITGAGQKAFCAGADLKERSGMSEQEVIQTVSYICETIGNVEKMRMPVIAAMNGASYGGGLELALACDIRLASSEAKMGLTETSLAIIPGAGGTQRLPRLIGIGQAKRLIYTAKPVTALEALKLGLIEQVTEPSNLLESAGTLAASIAENGPIAVSEAKTAINHGMQTDISTGLAIEHLSYKGTLYSSDRREGLKAFHEKRKPVYKGE